MSASVHALRPYTAAALVASGVGTWEFDVASGCFHLDSFAASVFGLTARKGANGATWAELCKAIPIEDQTRGEANMQRLLSNGGVFVYEHRVRPSPDDERWILARGRYDKNRHGLVTHGRGIVIDITDVKREGYAEGYATLTDSTAAERSPLDYAADLALELHGVLKEMGDQGNFSLLITEMLLRQIGKQLASTSQAGF